MSGATSPATFHYVVRCTFSAEAADLAVEWLDWLTDGHLADVLAAGALSADVIRVSGPELRYEVHYRFADSKSFAQYERDHAHRLRAEGLARFPPERGLHYERWTGDLIARQARAPAT
jgi:hypothetical protein